jgi:hypothetical protein
MAVCPPPPCAPLAPFQELQLSSCKRVGPLTMSALSSHARRLQRLNVTELFDVTDEGLLGLAANCKRLEFLACQGCLSISLLAMQVCGNWHSSCGCRSGHRVFSATGVPACPCSRPPVGAPCSPLLPVRCPCRRRRGCSSAPSWAPRGTHCCHGPASRSAACSSAWTSPVRRDCCRPRCVCTALLLLSSVAGALPHLWLWMYNRLAAATPAHTHTRRILYRGAVFVTARMGSKRGHML